MPKRFVDRLPHFAESCVCDTLSTLQGRIIALCMALEAMENQPEPVQVLGWL